LNEQSAAYTRRVRHDLPEVYDDRPLRGPQPPRTWPWVLAVIVLIAAGAAGWLYFQRKPAPVAQAAPVAIVPPKDQAAAIRALRLHLAQNAKSDCIALIGAGADGSEYRFNAFNQCENKRLGRWKVDRKTGAISPQ
jgi:hypothetical protein